MSGRPRHTVSELEKYFRSTKSEIQRKRKSRHTWWYQTIFWLLINVIFDSNRDPRFNDFFESLNEKTLTTAQGKIPLPIYIITEMRSINRKAEVSKSLISSIRKKIDFFQEEIMKPFIKCLVGTEGKKNVDEEFLKAFFDQELIIDIDVQRRAEIWFYLIKCHSLAGSKEESKYDKKIRVLIDKISDSIIDRDTGSSISEETKSTSLETTQINPQKKRKECKDIDYEPNTTEQSDNSDGFDRKKTEDVVENYFEENVYGPVFYQIRHAQEEIAEGCQQSNALQPEKDSKKFISRYEQESYEYDEFSVLFSQNNSNARESEKKDEDSPMKTSFELNSSILPTNEINLSSTDYKQDSIELKSQEDSAMDIENLDISEQDKMIQHSSNSEQNQENRNKHKDLHNGNCEEWKGVHFDDINADSKSHTLSQQIQEEKFIQDSRTPTTNWDSYLDEDLETYSTQASINEGNYEDLNASIDSINSNSS